MTYHQSVAGGHPGACACGQTFTGARGRLNHQHAQNRKRMDAMTCDKCGEQGAVWFRIRQGLCPYCREDDEARRDDLA